MSSVLSCVKLTKNTEEKTLGGPATNILFRTVEDRCFHKAAYFLSAEMAGPITEERPYGIYLYCSNPLFHVIKNIFYRSYPWLNVLQPIIAEKIRHETRN